MSLIQWFKGTSTNKVYTVSDITDATKLTGPLPVTGTSSGDVAAGATDSGNPVKVGGKYNSTPPTLTNGQRGDLQLGGTGSVRVQLHMTDSTGAIVASATSTDAQATSATAARLEVVSREYVFNGATYDRVRNNIDTTVLASAARTATPTKVDQTNYNGRSLVLVIDVTAVADTPSVVFTIQGKDPLSGKYYTILASAAIVGTGTTVLRVSPHYAAAVANLVAIDTVPRTWAVDAVHADADSITYTVAALWTV